MGSETVQIARTIVCPLESSQRKREYVREAVGEYQGCLETMAAMMPSITPHDWEAQNTTVARVAKEECNSERLYAHDRNDAAYKVAEAFGSRVSNNHTGEYPSFGDGQYIRICSCCSRVELVENDRGYGLWVKLLKRSDGVWFHLRGGGYQYDQLKAIVDGEASLGNVELHLTGDGVTAHISYIEDISTVEMDSCSSVLGVDCGQRVLYASAVRADDGDVVDVHVESGDEQRHYRERLSNTQSRRQQSGAKSRAVGVSERQRYTEQVMHTASRQIVDQATEQMPCCIVLEDLTGYRDTAQAPNHEWPYGSLQSKIAYKATGAGVPVRSVDPAYTSQRCRKCGTTDRASRQGIDFVCTSCGYDVHADVNAAMNVADRGYADIA